MSSQFFCAPAILLKRTPVWAVVLIGYVASANAQTGGANTSLPADPGMYVQVGSGFSKIIGQIAEFTRTGSKLVSGATFGIKSHKANIQLPGAHAQTIVSPQPVFYFIPPRQEAAAGVNAGDFILIRLEEKPQRRQFEVAAAGLFRASSGITLTHQIQVLRSEPRPGVYVITPAVELQKGEYALYLARGEGMAAYVYDFGVRQPLSARAIPGSTAPANMTGFTVRESAGTGTHALETTDPALSPTPTPSDQDSAADEPATPPASGRGQLGVFGANWEQSGTKGVQIVGVVQGSSAEGAGLRPGFVITYLNGVRVRSTQEFATILAKMDAGRRVNIGFLYKTSDGWMPKETIAILSKGD